MAPARRPAVAQCCFGPRNLSMGTKCPYRVLGLTPDESVDDESIKVAFRRKAKQMHPDVSDDPLAALAFMEVQHAYQTLLDPEKRAKYDKSLQAPRANSQVLSYLNARSAARHGVPPSRVPSRAPYMDRPELYSTMLELLQQVKSCAKHLEKEITGKDGRRASASGAGASFARAAASGAGTAAYGSSSYASMGSLDGVPPSATASSMASGGSSGSSAGGRDSPFSSAPPCVGRRVVADAECGDAECCEPWLYYAAAAAEEQEQQAQAQARRTAAARRRVGGLSAGAGAVCVGAGAVRTACQLPTGASEEEHTGMSSLRRAGGWRFCSGRAGNVLSR
ncbi:hypothetical protein HXX76_007485 [Chlamydomonas incerta]|uniref:J domain-containing protein n=1 Tax=Chlamydomonas incerta TaxID=51695 RepID=A0A835SWP3_CHLIN|nr:hypothetical protein HXX76_007485 [Chlamydomonas incerta]|eukprot:KAG2434589.1 hypothetical protein HXX76_007485 [Chlamydomonas incerta]